VKKLVIALLTVLASIFASAPAHAQLPPTNVFGIDFTANNTQTVSGANHFRIRYNSATGLLEVSKSGAAYTGITGNWVFNGDNTDLNHAAVQGVCNGATATGCAVGNAAHATTFNSPTLNTAVNTRIISALAAAGTSGISIEGDVPDGAATSAVDIRAEEPLTTGAIMSLYENFDTLRARFVPLNGDGLTIKDSGGSSTLNLSSAVGTSVCFGGSCYTAGTALTMTSAAADGTMLVQLISSSGFTTSGGIGLRIDFDANNVNNPTYGVVTNTATFAELGTLLNVSGSVTVGDVVVWVSGTANTVSRAAATDNLTTIAGIATVTQTGGTETIVTRGRALVRAQASITVGQLVGTSAGSAGSVHSGAIPAGAFVGRALESTGATAANMVTVYVTL